MKLDPIRKMLEHMLWADDLVADSLDRAPAASEEAAVLYAHVLGAEQIWLARILGTSEGPVWPDSEPAEIQDLRATVRQGYRSLVGELSDEELELSIAYTNSAGDAFDTRVEDILHHVFLHGAYHRGQVALALRKAGRDPAPTDYIAFVRGAPAATRTNSG